MLNIPRFIEMHYKTWISVLGWLLSVAGWTLWNVVLSAVYSNQNSTVYAVRSGFLKHFGGTGKWWLVIIAIIDSILIFEITLQAIKKIWLSSDVDVWQVLEKDKVIKRRLAEAAAGEAAGMDSGARISTEKGKVTTEEDEERDNERAILTPLTIITTGGSGEGSEHEMHIRRHSTDVISPREMQAKTQASN
jgi:phospholipid-translocating ATPase